jgi:hypothetical protein
MIWRFFDSDETDDAERDREKHERLRESVENGLIQTRQKDPKEQLRRRTGLE